MRKFPCRSAIIDGELIRAARTEIDFYGLMQGSKEGTVVCAFDLLELDGRDLRGLPLVERKAILQRLLSRSRNDRIVYVEHFADGERLIIACDEHGLEGVVSERRAAPYRSGPRHEWVKIKSLIWRDRNKDRGQWFEA